MKSAIFLIFVCVGAASASIEFTDLLKLSEVVADSLWPTPALPELPQDTCWGANNCTDDDDSIRKFTVSFSDDMIADLRSRIANRKNFTRHLNGTANTYGCNADFLDSFVDYWATEYNFTEAAERLNQYPHYKTKIQGLDIHYIHIKPKTKKKVYPLLMLHGWAFTAWEYIHTIPYLQNKTRDFEFEMIIPDLPGYGYSEATNFPGLSPHNIGIIFKNFMARLGHKKFYIQAGDLGQFIASDMAVLYPDDILGLHTNFAYSLLPKTLAKYVVGAWNTSAVVEANYTNRMYPLTTIFQNYMLGFGYFHMQATRPDTLAKGLEDSPSGLASWIVCLKMTSRQDGTANLLADDGNIWTGYNVNDLLDTLTIFWAQQNIATSIRLYAESLAVIQDPVNYITIYTPTKVPFGATKFRYEIIYQPDSFLKDKYPNLVYSRTLDYGGHSAAWENPAILATDIWDSITKMIEFNTPVQNQSNVRNQRVGKRNNRRY